MQLYPYVQFVALQLVIAGEDTLGDGLATFQQFHHFVRLYHVQGIQYSSIVEKPEMTEIFHLKKKMNELG